MDNKVTIEDSWNKKDFTIVCLDGVEYYMRAVSNHGYLAVKIDRDTLQPVRCNE